MRLDGKVALITGGGSGMGKVAAELFATEGARVVLTDVNDEAGEATATRDRRGRPLRPRRRLDGGRRRAHGRGDRRGVRPARRPLQQRRGRCRSTTAPSPRPTARSGTRCSAINVKGVAFGCKYGIPAMLAAGGGSIINVASFVAWLGAATSQTAYTASKGAVLAMTREIAVEYARKGIRCNALCPGPIETPLLLALLSDEEKKQRRFVHIPMGRLGQRRGAREGGAVPRERRLLVHDRGLADRRRRDHRRLRDARGLSVSPAANTGFSASYTRR